MFQKKYYSIDDTITIEYNTPQFLTKFNYNYMRLYKKY